MMIVTGSQDSNGYRVALSLLHQQLAPRHGLRDGHGAFGRTFDGTSGRNASIERHKSGVRRSVVLTISAQRTELRLLSVRKLAGWSTISLLPIKKRPSVSAE
jgi:hypothetical protein